MRGRATPEVTCLKTPAPLGPTVANRCQAGADRRHDRHVAKPWPNGGKPRQAVACRGQGLRGPRLAIQGR